MRGRYAAGTILLLAGAVFGVAALDCKRSEPGPGAEPTVHTEPEPSAASSGSSSASGTAATSRAAPTPSAMTTPSNVVFRCHSTSECPSVRGAPGACRLRYEPYRFECGARFTKFRCEEICATDADCNAAQKERCVAKPELAPATSICAYVAP